MKGGSILISNLSDLVFDNVFLGPNKNFELQILG